MKVLHKYFNQYMSLVLLLLMSISIHAGPLQLSHEPLFLNQTVPPALAVTFDDSGSMSWAYMPDSRGFSSNRPSFASPDYNLIYYNPTIVYKPPVNADGSSFPNSVFNNAKRDGYAPVGMISNRDLRSKYKAFRTYYPDYANENYSINYAQSGRANQENRAFYYVWKGPEATSLADRRIQNGNYALVEITGAEQEQNFANWYTYYNTRSKLAKAAVSQAFVNFGPDFKIDWQQLNRNRFNSGTNRMETFETDHREDFYDWLFHVPGSGGTPLRQATRYAGELFSDNYAGQSVYYSDVFAKELTCQQNFHIAISDGSWNGNRGVQGNYDNAANSVAGAGVAYDSALAAKYFYSDTNTDTLADTAFYYWLKDLKPSMENKVPRFIDDFTDSKGVPISVASSDNWWENEELYWNPKNDPANWQHMVNFNIGLGIEGGLNTDTDLPGLRSGALSWPKTINDTCFKRDLLGVEVVRNCANHACYDGDERTSNVVNCNGSVIPVGDIQSCWNLDSNTKLTSCADRIVRRVSEPQGRVDDVWHSSLNSRGKYFSAKDPAELSEALYKVVANIIKRKGRASAGSVSSNIISNETLAYKTGYDSSDWIGFVTASKINADGTLGDVEWDAACNLTGGACPSLATDTNISPSVPQSIAPSARKIFTYNYDTKTKHPFLGSNMSTEQVTTILDSDYFRSITPTITDLTGAAESVIDYVRGERTLEQQNGGDFRTRRSLLGDVINSSAKTVRGPSASYNDNFWSTGSPERLAADLTIPNGYSEFRIANGDRNNVLLVGANDGMLHAFDAGINSDKGGDELWAYVPSKALDGLSEFANPTSTHKSYVDAAPFVQDAFINNNWTTVALGGMRYGGKLFYALDLGGNPEDEPNVLWEFTDENDSDMGYSYSGGIISRVAYPNSAGTAMQSKWIAFVPNGYNSTNQKSVMFAIDLKTGQVLHKWNTGFGDINNPNGMGSPVAADFIAYDDTDTTKSFYGADQGADFVYAGDLHGNLYRFNVADIFTGNDTTEILYKGSQDRSITAAPRLFTPDDGSENIIVTFGTGKYLELSDRGISGVTPQYIFGLTDSKAPVNVYTFSDVRIVEQTIDQDDISIPPTRRLSENEVAVGGSWKIKLPQNGERSTNTFGRNNQAKLLVVASIIPNGDDPCVAGGASWLMIFDATTGSTPVEGKIFANQNADGVKIDTLVTGTPGYLTTPGGNQSILTIDGAGAEGENNNIAPILLDKGERWRRRSWHRINFD
jgi:type IV pilus assembly protein PilY1